MITPNNNAIIWRNLAKKLRLRQVIVGRQVTGTWFKGTSGYKKPPPREEMAASFLRGCSCVQALLYTHLFTTLTPLMMTRPLYEALTRWPLRL